MRPILLLSLPPRGPKNAGRHESGTKTLHMARRRKKRTLKPRTPARVKKKKRSRGPRGQQHPELVGLLLVAFGLFLGSIIYAGWSGGVVGGALADGVRGATGAAAYAVPLAFLALGGLMVGRSALVDLRPFRTGLLVLALGLELALGRAHSGLAGRALESVFGTLLGGTGSTILGATALTVGALLLSGASAGALLRRSGRAVRNVRARRPAPPAVLPPPAPPPTRIHTPPVDAVHDFPDVVGETVEPPPLLVEEPEPEEEPSLFDVRAGMREEYRLPDRELLRRSPEATPASAQAGARVAEALVQTLAHFGVEATIVGQIAGPRVTRYELQLGPGTKVSKGAAAVLANVVGEMERRYERLSAVRARSLPEANRAFRSRREDPLPYLLVVIDELADLMMISPQEVE